VCRVQPHTIVHVRDRWAVAGDVGGVLGPGEPTGYGPFAVLELDNGVSLDRIDDADEIGGQHYAFLAGQEEFDAIRLRL
jgi:hypothetical protein